MTARKDLEPLHLVEDGVTSARFLIYSTQSGVRTELRFDEEQPWFTQAQLADIFGVDVRTVNEHVQNFIRGGELGDSVIRKFRITAADGKSYSVQHYALDVAFYVGYRVNSKQGVLFRRWATQILLQYAVKGFVLDQRRLENPGGQADFFDELLDRIRQIRASEKRMYTRILELASFCSDYHAMSEDDKQNFFATIQNAMHWAVTGETAADFVYHNIDAAKPDCGVVHFDREARDIPTAAEAGIAKNHYGEPQIKALNLLTSAALEFFESQAEQRRLTTIAQFAEKMREFIKFDGRPLIPARYRGKVSDTKKKEKVAGELAIYRERVRLEKEAKGEVEVGKLLEQARRSASEKRKTRSTPKKK